MAKVVLVIEDNEAGDEVAIKFTADTSLSNDFNQHTLAQLLAIQLHEALSQMQQD